MNVATSLQSARRRAGLSQTELARRANTSQAFISDIERGRVNPSVDRLERLLLLTGQHLEVVGEDPNPQIDPHDLELMRRNLHLTPAERLAQLRNRMRLRGLARR